MNISIFFSCVMLVGLIFSIPLVGYLEVGGFMLFVEWQFSFVSSSSFNLSLIFDTYGVFFSCIVMFISMNVFMFSYSYMAGDTNLVRFSMLVFLFVLSMNLLIYVPNMMALLLGWDGLGLTSFLLVIYYQNKSSLAGGMLTALTNRIGDALIILSIAFMLQQGHWLVVSCWGVGMEEFIMFTVMVAAMTKSAQVPFSSWLPAAMAAPTPVSALVHSSTLVTAGVFLLFRFYPFLSEYSMFCKVLLYFATLTSLMAGMSAMVECDMKKIIALSTLSQLGVMMVALGLGSSLYAYFHLVTHALFKALLFICAGVLIHLHSHSQDLRFMGNLINQSPFISSSLMVSNIALCGGPFLAGFYSKDLILELFVFSPNSLLMVFLFYFATGLTVAYSIRFLLSVIWGPNMSSSMHCVEDKGVNLIIPMGLLAIFSVIGGAGMNWVLFIDFYDMFLSIELKLMVIVVSLLGGVFSWYGNSLMSSSSSYLMGYPIMNYSLGLMWFLSPLSTQKIIGVSFWIGHQLLKVLDQGWEEVSCAKNIMSLGLGGSNFIQPMQSILSVKYLFYSGFVVICAVVFYL